MNRIQDNLIIPRTIASLTAAERRDFSYCKLLRFMVRGKLQHDVCLESELSYNLAYELGPTPANGSMYLPLALSTRAGLDTKSGAAGGYMVGSDVGGLIELLRAKSMLVQLSSPLITIPRSVSLPVQNAGSSATWVGENPGSDVAATDSTFGQRSLIPHSLLISTSLSRKLLLQTDGTAEAIIRGDLARAMAAALDKAGIQGSGTESQPVGLLNTTGVGLVSINTNGGTVAYSHLCDMEDAVADNHADVGPLSFLTTPGMRTKLRQTESLTGSGIPLWAPAAWAPGASALLGYRAEVSANCPSTLTKGTSANSCHLVAFGDFRELLLGQFGQPSILLDPFKQKKSGMIECTLYVDLDCLVRRPESFCLITDAKTS